MRSLRELGEWSTRRLVLAFTLVCLLPLVLLTWTTQQLTEDAVESEVRARVVTTAVVSAESVRREMSSLAELVQSYASRPYLASALQPGVPSADRAAVRTFLDELRGLRPGIQVAFVADTSGRLLEIRPETPAIVGTSFAFRDWYRGVQATGKPYISGGYKSAAAGAPVVVGAAVQVRDTGRGSRATGRQLGILTAGYSVDELQRWSRDLGGDQRIDLTITDQAGQALAGRHVAAGSLNRLRADPAVAAALSGQTGVIEGQRGGRRWLRAYAPVADIGWAVVAEVDKDIALSGAADVRRRTLLNSVLRALILLGGLGLLIGALASRARSEERVRRSDARSRSVIEEADAYIAMNSEGLVTGWNSRAEETFGWTHAEALGARLSSLVIPPAYRELHEAGLRQALKTREGAVLNRRIEITALRKDGSEFPVELVIWPLWDDEEATFNAFLHDITARHHAAAALDWETRLTTLLQKVAVASNEATDLELALRAGLDAVCTAMGWPVGHALVLDDDDDGRVVGDIWLVSDRAAYAAFELATEAIDFGPGVGLPGRVIRSGAPQWIPDLDADLEFVRRDAALSVGLRSGIAFPVLAGPDLVGVLEFFSADLGDPDERLLDVMRHAGAQLGRVVERRRTELALAAARDAALETSQLKSAFLANMSHEIRTPMNGVLGMTSLLLDSELDARQREYAETVRVSAESLLIVINDILDFSKIEAGKLEIEHVAYVVRNVVEGAVEVLADHAYDKGVELATLVSPDVPAAVVGDPGRLRQLLLNLVGNAVKFTEQGEVVLRVTAAGGSDDQGSPDRRLRFEVVDTGIGIDPDQLERLFDPFSQADVSTTRRYGGTGLGLAICAQLVDLMGGQIGATSEPGAGSTFWFEVPLVAVGDEAVVLPARRDSVRGMRIAVVDDNATNREVLQEYLNSWGVSVTAFASPLDALSALTAAAGQGPAFDAAILDYQMPDMDGLEMARRIRRDPALVALPIVLLTSSAQRGDAAAAAAAGVGGYLTKPVRSSHLYDVLATVVDGRSAPRPRPIVTRHLLLPESKGPRVLLAEDNPINQKVAVSMVERLGYRVDVAQDGSEAVRALRAATHPYVAVLMDCQMPVLDGYAATAAIRELEAAAGVRRTPVIAMTAGAMAGDRERCLVSGMDDYVPKPVRPEELAAALERWAPLDGATSDAPPEGAPDVEPLPALAVGTRAVDDADPVLDAEAVRRLQALDDRAGGTMISEFVGLFLASSPKRVETIQVGVASGDLEGAAFAAHALTGSCGVLGALELARLCAAIEVAGRQGDRETAAAHVAALSLLYDRTCAALRQIAERSRGGDLA